MFMRYQPAAFNPSVTDGRTPPHFKPAAIRQRAGNSVKAVAKSYISARRDTEVANLEADWTVEG